MSFGPKGSILPEWHDYYRKLGMSIPNQELGTSPNMLIKQGSIDLVGNIMDI